MEPGPPGWSMTVRWWVRESKVTPSNWMPLRVFREMRGEEGGVGGGWEVGGCGVVGVASFCWVFSGRGTAGWWWGLGGCGVGVQDASAVRMRGRRMDFCGGMRGGVKRGWGRGAREGFSG